MTPGLFGVQPGLTNRAYHASPGLSVSGAKRLLRTPYHYHAFAHGARTATATPQQFNGTLVHCALLEPDAFYSRYAVAPADDKRSKAYKEFAEWCASHNVEPITDEQCVLAHSQADALRELPDVAKLLDRGTPECSVYWHDPLTGVHCKCRPDHASPGWGPGGHSVILLDVKTAKDASPSGFAKAVHAFSYHMQDAWYCEGYKLATGRPVIGMLFAVVESESPYAAAVYTLDEQALEAGRNLCLTARTRYAECMRRNEWPSYSREVTEIKLPAWALRNPADD